MPGRCRVMPGTGMPGGMRDRRYADLAATRTAVAAWPRGSVAAPRSANAAADRQRNQGRTVGRATLGHPSAGISSDFSKTALDPLRARAVFNRSLIPKFPCPRLSTSIGGNPTYQLVVRPRSLSCAVSRRGQGAQRLCAWKRDGCACGVGSVPSTFGSFVHLEEGEAR